jgi:hypothetical protein
MRTEKRCPTCKRTLPLSDFHKNRNAGDGVQGWCKECFCKRRRRYYAQFGVRDADNFAALKRAAVRRAIIFQLSLEDYLVIISKQCSYGEGSRPAFAIGVDRKDPAGIYSKQNCVPSCNRHNRLKGGVLKFESMLQIVGLFPEAKACGDVERKLPRKFKRPGSAVA